MMKTALGILAAAICVPGNASTIGGTGGAIALQFEPHYLRAWRDEARPLRPQATVEGENVAFDPPTVTSPSTGSRTPLPVTVGNFTDKDVPANPKGWEGGPDSWGSEDEGDIWSDPPGQSNEEAVLVPERSGAEGGLDPRDGLATPRDIDGDGNLGEAPEPSTVLLMGGALVGLGLLRKKRNS